MKTKFFYTLAFCILLLSVSFAHQPVEQWGRFEAVLKGTSINNPFTDVDLKATFTNGEHSVTVNGFYDGGGQYKFRFMPELTGTWTYITSSNMAVLDNKSGSFECVPATGNNHGMVQVSDTHHFRYADGTPYYPFGTTMYAFLHPNMEREEQTLRTLAESPFNKIRICLFPKTYGHNNDEPRYYPYRKAEGVELDPSNNNVAVWDFSRFDTEMFAHLERRIDDLEKIGVQCDLILYHPYDGGHFGFDRMSRANDLHYLRYVTARLSSFRNVWWSLANEWDDVETKSWEDWFVFLETVTENDPYNHLISNHNGKKYFDYHHPLITHVSIQNESVTTDFGRAGLAKDTYRKPVIYDEICYEGDYSSRWGNKSGEEITYRFWQAYLVGTYATHGEVFHSDDHIAWTEKGGILRGTSAPRIMFLKNLIDRTGTFRLIDNWNYHNASVSESGQVLVYLGKEAPEEWEISIPSKVRWGNRANVKIEMIDTWNMTITEIDDVFDLRTLVPYEMVEKNGKTIKTGGKQYMAFLITKIDE